MDWIKNYYQLRVESIEHGLNVTEVTEGFVDDVERSRREAVPVFFKYAPYGDTAEMYYLQLMLKALPFDRKSFENIISEGNKSRTYCEEAKLRGLSGENYDEAYQYLSKYAKSGFSYTRLLQLANKMSAMNFIEDDSVVALLKTVAPDHLRIENLLFDNIMDDISDYPLQTTEEYNLTFSDTQRKAFSRITSKMSSNCRSPTARGDNQVMTILTGGAGAGKSHLIKALISHFNDKGLTYKITATTGTAARIINGTTLHSAFWLNAELTCSLERGIPEASMLDQVDVIIIDEFSMLSRALLNKVNLVCRQFTSDLMLRNEAFGGKSVILCGDVLQLPPIDQPIYTRDIMFPFEIIVLEGSMRQNDPVFTTLLNDIRLAKFNKRGKELLESRLFSLKDLPRLDDSEVLYITPTTAQRDVLNDRAIARLNGNFSTFEAIDVGPNITKVSEAVRNHLKTAKKQLPPATLRIKVGCKVMLTRNICLAAGWVNGTLCIVDSINEDLEYVIVRSQAHPDKVLEVSKKAFPFEVGNKQYSREQLPLIVAYAVTIHKIQGQTLSKVVIDCLGLFASGQFYTAISRAKTLEDVYLFNWDGKKFYTDPSYIQLWDWMNRVNVIGRNPIDKKTIDFPVVLHMPQTLSQAALSPTFVAIATKRKERAQTARKTMPSTLISPLPSRANEEISRRSPVDIRTRSTKQIVEKTRKMFSELPSPPTPRHLVRKSSAREIQTRSQRALLKIQEIYVKCNIDNNLTVARNFMPMVLEFVDTLEFIEEKRLQLTTMSAILFPPATRDVRPTNFFAQFNDDYRILPTTADGSCLFNAFSKAYFGHELYSDFFRLLCIKNMVHNQQYFIDNRLRLAYEPRIKQLYDYVYHASFFGRVPERSWGEGKIILEASLNDTLIL